MSDTHAGVRTIQPQRPYLMPIERLATLASVGRCSVCLCLVLAEDFGFHTVVAHRQAAKS